MKVLSSATLRSPWTKTLGGAKLHPTGTVNILCIQRKTGLPADRSTEFRYLPRFRVQVPNHRHLRSQRTLRAAEVLPYGSTEFAHDYSHLSVIFSGAKAGTKLSDSFIGVRRHNITSISAMSLAGCWPGHIMQGLRTATRKVFPTLLSALGKDNTADTVL